ncbi:MAG: hypothetical protein AABM30_03365 [Actinomycetota bacterium]
MVTETTTQTLTETAVVTQKPESTVYVPEAGGTPEYKPDVIYIGVSGNAYSIKEWLDYGGPVAKAIATWDYNDCKPYCAAGKVTTVHVTISLARRTPCKGVPAYADLRVDKTDNEALSSEGDEQDLAVLCSEG